MRRASNVRLFRVVAEGLAAIEAGVFHPIVGVAVQRVSVQEQVLGVGVTAILSALRWPAADRGGAWAPGDSPPAARATGAGRDLPETRASGRRHRPPDALALLSPSLARLSWPGCRPRLPATALARPGAAAGRASRALQFPPVAPRARVAALAARRGRPELITSRRGRGPLRMDLGERQARACGRMTVPP